MEKIEEMFCFAAVDDNGDEGILAIHTDTGPMPLVGGGDTDRITSLLSAAKHIEKNLGKEVRLYKFTHKEEIDWKSLTKEPRVFACAPEDVLKYAADPNYKPVMK